jgi:hypothetical protein
MKKNLLLTCVLSLLLSGVSFSQLAIQNGDFALPADGAKYKADGSGTPRFNNNVPGWWASPGAGDCGREGSYVGYAHNRDSYNAVTHPSDSGSIWAVAGTVQPGLRSLSLTFTGSESWPQGTALASADILIMFATYTGTDTVGFTIVSDTLRQPWDASNPDYTFTYDLPASTEGKNLLIGFDVANPAAETWLNFDNFVLTASATTPPTGIKNGSQANNTSLYPNPTSDYITIETKVNESSKYSLIHSTGKEMLTGYVNNNERIDISSLDRGIYFLNIQNSLGSEVIKTVIK